MSSIEVLGKQLSTDEEGYLENLTDWNADVATAMAELDGCNPVSYTHLTLPTIYSV